MGSVDVSLARRMVHRLSAAAVTLLVALLGLYRRLISSGLRPRCRFTPSCSEYAVLSLQKYGVIKGLAKTGWRVCRCHPFGRPGYDPP